MPLASASAAAAQNAEQLGLAGWNTLLMPNVTPPAATPGGAVASTLLTAATPGTPQTAAAPASAGATSTTGGTGASTFPAAVDPDIMARLQAAYADYRPGETGAPQVRDPVTGYDIHARFGEPTYNGEGSQLSLGPLTGYSVGNYDTATGASMRVYDAAGKDTGQSEYWKADAQRWMDDAAMLAAGGFMGAFGAAVPAAGAGAAGSDTALTVQGDSINALDHATGVGYGSEAPGSLLTGPTSVNADYSLLTGTNISDPSGIVLEGNAGQGVNVAARSGEGLVMNTSPNMAAMGGAQGVTTSGAQVLGDSSSFINDPALQAIDAGKQVISEPGIYTPEHPYTPDLGDPNSFINGGTGGVTPPAQTLWDQIKGLFTTPPGTTGSAFPSALPSILPPIIQQLLTPEPTPTPPPVAYTPPQPEVGAGAYTQANAQGGAAGSMAGVASTLLTARDTFGYGRTMLA